VTGVAPVAAGDGVHAFRRTTGTGPDRLAAWAGGDDPLGEGGPARRVRLDWPYRTARATDVSGRHPELRLDHGTVELDLDETPVFITAAED